MAHSSTAGQSFQNWDPMRDAFQDPNFNTYKEGPAANLDLDKQPCFTSSSQKRSGQCKLYVGNIPIHIDKDGIENIFRICGQPIAVYRHQQPMSTNRTWGFVTFASYREAESAMRELNHKPPMNFNIEFARGTEPDDKIKIVKQIDSAEPTLESQDLVAPRRSLSKNAVPSGKGRGLAVTPYVDPRTPGSGVFTEETSDIRNFQQYVGSNFDEPNALLMRGVQRTNGSEGPRKFVNGRSCFDRDMDKLCKPQKLGNIVPDMFEVKNSVENYMQKMNGHYEYSKKEYREGQVQGTCTYCGKDAVQFCARCKDWYCSRACQEKDWPRHKRYCIPTLRNTKDIQFNDAGDTKGNREQTPSSMPKQDRENKYAQQKVDNVKKDIHDNSQSKVISPNRLRYSKRNDFEYPKKDFHNASKYSAQRSASVSQEKDFVCIREDSDIQKEGRLLQPKKSLEKVSLDNQNHRNNSKVNSSELNDVRKQSPKGKRGGGGRYQKRTEENNSMTIDAGNILNQSKESTWQEVSHDDAKASNRGILEKVNTKLPTNGEQLEPLHEREQLPTTSFTNVKVQIALGSGEYWVQLSSKVNEVFSLSIEMEKYKESVAVDPCIGMYCMAKYDGIWYRAKITSVVPNVKVHFIDFGNEETAAPGELKVLPDCVRHMKAQAIRITLASGTSQKYQSVGGEFEFSVKAVHENETGVLTVHVEGETYKPSLTASPSDGRIELTGDSQDIALQSITVLLKQHMTCYLFVTEYIDDQEFLASLVPSNMRSHYNSLFNGDLNEDCQKKSSENFMPELGEAVLAKDLEEGWVRGYVLHVSPMKEFTVACCDTGLVKYVQDVRKMPPNLREITQFAVQGRVLDNVSKAKEHVCELTKINVVIESTQCDSAIAVVENDSGECVCKLELKKWVVPFELYQDLKCVELKEGECVISAEMSAVEMYIRPMNTTCIEIYNRLMQDVPKYCFRAPCMKHTPKVGQVLAAKFSEDGNFYRAVVRDIHHSKGIKVQYIDFGNVECVPQDSLKPLPKELRDIECCVVKVALKDVADRPLNEAVQNFFKELIAVPMKLKVKFTDPSNNKVDLYTKDNTHVNEKINKMLVPGWKKGVSDTRIYTVDDMVVEKLELNSTVDLVIKLVVDHKTIVVRWQKSKVINLLENDLQMQMDEYCQRTEESYTPRELELCLSNVDNLWQRCLCLSGGNPLSLYQLDVGTVTDTSHQTIRRFRQEFTTLAAVAVWCEIRTKVNLSKEIQEYMTKYLTTMKVITANILNTTVSPTGLKGYTIVIPELDEYLQTL